MTKTTYELTWSFDPPTSNFTCNRPTYTAVLQCNVVPNLLLDGSKDETLPQGYRGLSNFLGEYLLSQVSYLLDYINIRNVNISNRFQARYSTIWPENDHTC
ncbi:hypothetical protein AVEN_261553-1 [Araneus ventricosus]|uniref:Uncharacterized protein n=1 Tax=Araneus ventricosus TaxID=182803 RepID=A0A4Y2JW42_ARAVE|nr:hypothetical protein AVEN_261553-1 [Araneus ventricosus]